MKAQVESPNSSSNSPTSNGNNNRAVHDGRIHKSKPRKEEENEEIKMYLAKLQDLVPFMPKNKKLSKLEVIQYVIDYIRDLRQTLGMPPSVVPSAPARIPSVHLPNHHHHHSHPCAPMTNINNVMDFGTNSTPSTPSATDAASSNSTSSHSLHLHHHQRQPLGVISTPSNSPFLSSAGSNCSTQEHNNNQIPHQLMDKSSTDIDTRPVSC